MSLATGWKRAAFEKPYIALEVEVFIITERFDKSSGLNNDWDISEFNAFSVELLNFFDVCSWVPTFDVIFKTFYYEKK